MGCPVLRSCLPPITATTLSSVDSLSHAGGYPPAGGNFKLPGETPAGEISRIPPSTKISPLDRSRDLEAQNRDSAQLLLRQLRLFLFWFSLQESQRVERARAAGFCRQLWTRHTRVALPRLKPETRAGERESARSERHGRLAAALCEDGRGTLCQG